MKSHRDYLASLSPSTQRLIAKFEAELQQKFGMTVQPPFDAWQEAGW